MIEDHLRRAARALDHSIAEVDVPQRLAQLTGRRRQQRVTAVTVGVIVAAAVFAAGIAAGLAVGTHRTHRSATPAPTSPATRPGGTIAGSTSPPGRVAATIPVPGHPGTPAVGDGGVWVPLTLEDHVVRIDPATNAVVATIAVPRGPSRLAVAPGAVWVLSSVDRSVSRIDPTTNKVAQTIPVGRQPAGITVAAGAVWVSNTLDDTVLRIDPATGRVVKTISVRGPGELATSGTHVWVTSTGGMSRIDPATDQATVFRQPANTCCGEIAATSQGIWIINGNGALLRLDPATSKVVATTVLALDPFPASIAVSGDSVWVASAPRRTGDPDLLWRIDLAHNQVTGILTIGPAAYGKAPTSIATGTATGSPAVWVAKGTDQTVLRLQPTP